MIAARGAEKSLQAKEGVRSVREINLTKDIGGI
jgi:hypothetical protein